MRRKTRIVSATAATLVPATETKWPGKERPELARGERRAVADAHVVFPVHAERVGEAVAAAIDSRLRVSSSPMTLYALRTPDDLLWRCASPARRLGDAGGGPNVHPPARALSHDSWQRLVAERAARLDLAPLLAVQPLQGNVPDFLTPPPRTPARVYVTSSPRSARRRRHRSHTSSSAAAKQGTDERYRRWSTASSPILRGARPARRAAPRSLGRARRAVLGAHPDVARPRHRAALAHARAARPAPCPQRAAPADSLDEARPLVRRPHRPHRRSRRARASADAERVPGAQARRGHRRAVATDDRLPRPWCRRPLARAQPTAGGLARLLGRTRALVLASLDRPLSTTALAALIELSPAGASRHLLALRDAGIVATTRQGHEVRYRRDEPRLGAPARPGPPGRPVVA